MNTDTLFEHFDSLVELPGGVAKMRELILQLAVQGKLVEQDERDEPANKLVQRIRTGRRRLIETADLTDGLGDLEAEDDLNTSLPKGWAWIRLGELGGFLGGGTPSKARSDYWGGDIPWVSPKDMKRPYIFDAIDHVTTLGADSSSGKMIPAGAMLMVIRGMILVHSFPIALAMRSLVINQDMKALVLVEREVGEYLIRCCAALKSKMLDLVERSSHGTCRIPSEAIARFWVPLPPLAEQRRIVAKVDQLMALCDELEARQERKREGRERLVESSLAKLLAARDPAEFSEHWHRLRGHFDDIFDCVTSIAKLRDAICAMAIDGRFDTCKSSEGKSNEVMLGELLREPSLNGCSKRPSDDTRGVPILRISAGTSRKDGLVDEADFKWVELDDDEIEKFLARPNDLFACRFNGNLHYVGRFSLYGGASKVRQVFPDKLIRFRINEACAEPQYVKLAMNSRQIRQRIESFCATTAGNIGISASNLRSVKLPVPSLDEQRRIVATADHLWALCDQAESRMLEAEVAGQRFLASAVIAILRPNCRGS